MKKRDILLISLIFVIAFSFSANANLFTNIWGDWLYQMTGNVIGNETNFTKENIYNLSKEESKETNKTLEEINRTLKGINQSNISKERLINETLKALNNTLNTIINMNLTKEEIKAINETISNINETLLTNMSSKDSNITKEKLGEINKTINEINSRLTNISKEECKGGCITEKSKCVPYGTRVGKTYCSIYGGFDNQRAEGNSCDNNYECITNECSSGKCISTYGVLQKIWMWLNRLFRFG